MRDDFRSLRRLPDARPVDTNPLEQRERSLVLFDSGDEATVEPAKKEPRRCHVKQFYARNAVTRLCSTFVLSMP